MFGYLEQKLLGRLFFLKSNFYVSENFKFQCDPFSNRKDVSQRSIWQLFIPRVKARSPAGGVTVKPWSPRWICITTLFTEDIYGQSEPTWFCIKPTKVLLHPNQLRLDFLQALYILAIISSDGLVYISQPLFHSDTSFIK
jgi:hypothetical protein